MTTLNNPFPSWNDTGTDPDTTSGFGKDYTKGDTVEAQHLDFLWYEVESFASDVVSEFDTEVIRRDGSVSMNDAFDVDGNDIEDGTTTVWNSTQGTVASNSVNNSAISANAVDSNEINSDAVTGTEIASSAVSSSEIASSAVGSSELENDSITVSGYGGLGSGTASLGSTVTIGVVGDLDVAGNDIENVGGNNSASGSIGIISGGIISWENISGGGETYITGGGGTIQVGSNNPSFDAFYSNGGLTAAEDGSQSSPAVTLGQSTDAGFYVDGGEVYVVDESGNTTQLS